ncbi:MAG: methyltransferase domain-containing protein [Glaciimonas sp.]|nr:methyltransferase domain-containing protein [Glaciimonas sp.]
MSDHHKHILTEVADYYSKKLVAHGESAQGVDWNGEQSQMLRFRQLCRIINGPGHFSINEIGCGYGALCDFLAQEYPSYRYTGIDISEKMIEAGRRRHSKNDALRFILSSEPDQVADYGVASGIFNIRLQNSYEEWRSYVECNLNVLNETSRLGFSFNCLTSYSDAEHMQPHLFYPDPASLFELCKRRYSRNVALLHDYDLYEFTILVRKVC